MAGDRCLVGRLNSEKLIFDLVFVCEKCRIYFEMER